MQNELSKPTSTQPSNTLGSLQPKGFPGLPDGWASDIVRFKTADQSQQLFSIFHHPINWKDSDTCKAMVISHGIGEHGGRYLHFPHFLKDVCSAYYAIDHRGHGRSEGQRGYIEDFDLYADDLQLSIRNVHDFLKKNFKNVEIHLFGHSMGALIALRTLLLYQDLPVQSAILSALPFKVKMTVPWVKIAAAHVLSRAWGSVHFANEIDARDVSRDPHVVEAYKKDRLVHSKITPRLYVTMMEKIDDSLKRAFSLNFPTMMITPLGDRLIEPKTQQSFFDDLRMKEKELKTYPDYYHESFNDLGKEKVFEDMKAWISRNSSKN
jgi:acylglycerol lipase